MEIWIHRLIEVQFPPSRGHIGVPYSAILEKYIHIAICPPEGGNWTSVSRWIQISIYNTPTPIKRFELCQSNQDLNWFFPKKIKPYFYNLRSKSVWSSRMSPCLGELAMERKTKHCQKIIITVQFVWNGWYKIQSIIFVYKATFRNSYLGTSSSIIGFQTFCWSCRRWRQFYCSLKVWKFPPTKSCHHTMMTS